MHKEIYKYLATKESHANLEGVHAAVDMTVIDINELENGIELIIEFAGEINEIDLALFELDLHDNETLIKVG